MTEKHTIQDLIVRVRAWTGPCATYEFADRLRQAGFRDVLAGTEHVYGSLNIIGQTDSASVELEAENLYALKFGKTGLKFKKFK